MLLWSRNDAHEFLSTPLRHGAAVGDTGPRNYGREQWRTTGPAAKAKSVVLYAVPRGDAQASEASTSVASIPMGMQDARPTRSLSPPTESATVPTRRRSSHCGRSG